jgi:hypothetical protein
MSNESVLYAEVEVTSPMRYALPSRFRLLGGAPPLNTQ